MVLVAVTPADTGVSFHSAQYGRMYICGPDDGSAGICLF